MEQFPLVLTALAAQVLCSQFGWWGMVGLAILEGFSSHQNCDLSAQERLFQLSQKVPFPLGRAGLVGECGVLSGCSARGVSAVVFQETSLKCVYAMAKASLEFSWAAGSFPGSIVLCVNSSWGRCVVITALGGMGGKEIPFSLQSCALFFCLTSLGLEVSVGFGAEGNSLYPCWGQNCLLPSRKYQGTVGGHPLCQN